MGIIQMLQRCFVQEKPDENESALGSNHFERLS